VESDVRTIVPVDRATTAFIGRTPRRRLLLNLWITLALSRCSFLARKDRNNILEDVAKDWSLTIRASQIIPIYPMSEDIQPGDLFLVLQTADDQHKTYTQGRFLRLDTRLGRVSPTGYGEFYADSFFNSGEEGPLTRRWLKPTNAQKNRRVSDLLATVMLNHTIVHMKRIEIGSKPGWLFTYRA